MLGCHAATLDGDFVDCGVSTGIYAWAVINFVHFEKLNNKYYLLDMFFAMDPRYSSESEMKRNDILKYPTRGRYEQVKKTFANFNAEIIRGPILRL
jgi:O-methyltransferase